MNEHKRIKVFDRAPAFDSMQHKPRAREKHCRASEKGGRASMNSEIVPDIGGFWNTIIFLIVVSALFIGTGLIAWRLSIRKP